MSTHHITMTQMAKELCLNRTTISAVINGREKQQRIPTETAERIREYLDKRGYVQSKSALQMKTGGMPDAVGILYCGKFMPFSHLIEALSLLTEAVETRSGVVEITGISQEKLREGLREQVGKGIKRLIWIHAGPVDMELRNMEALLPFLSQMERIVNYNFGDEFDRRELPENLWTVGFDRPRTYRLVAELWKQRGHRKIAISELFYNSTGGLPASESLREIFEHEGFEAFGLHPEERIGLSDEESARFFAENLIALHKNYQVSCAFIRNELQVAQTMSHLLARGIRIPEDIALIGFGDNNYLNLLPVPLTTFKHPVVDMCEKTVELLYDNSSDGVKKFMFESSLVLRQSH